MTPKLLRFKWTVSKGRDTYGYNIVSLYVDGSKVASCNGGGYDMQGTCLGLYLMREYQDRLMRISDKAGTIAMQGDEMGWVHVRQDNGLYGMTLLQPKKLKPHVSLDGACGESSMVRIAKEAGIILTSTRIGKKEWGYFLTD